MSKIASDYLIFSNKKYGHLTTTTSIKKIGRQWCIFCRCDCGNAKFICVTHVVPGVVKNCGMSCPLAILTRQQQLALFRGTHGMSKTRIYSIWAGMKDRCTNIDGPKYSSYGGRGIEVCEAWKTFEGFYKDVGESYTKHVAEFGEKNTTADRYPDVNGNYEPSNFRWATNNEQQKNTRRNPKIENLKEHNYWINKFSVNIHHIVRLRKDHRIAACDIYLGISPLEIRSYIESLWLPSMSWDNYGRGSGRWNIDHIIPCNQFDLSKEENRKICFNYKNLQPLWSIDNQKKTFILMRASNAS